MVEPEPAEDVIFARLMESIGQLHQDLDRVELWLGALDCFQTPVPDFSRATGLFCRSDPRLRAVAHSPKTGLSSDRVAPYCP